MRAVAELQAVQVSSPHLAMPVHSDVGQVLIMTAAAVLLAGGGLLARRRAALRRGCESAQGRLVGTIGDEVEGPPLAIVEYIAAGRRYRLPALLPRRHRSERAAPPLTVLYKRTDPTVAQLDVWPAAGQRVMVAAAVILALGTALLF